MQTTQVKTVASDKVKSVRVEFPHFNEHCSLVNTKRFSLEQGKAILVLSAAILHVSLVDSGDAHQVLQQLGNHSFIQITWRGGWGYALQVFS